MTSAFSKAAKKAAKARKKAKKAAEVGGYSSVDEFIQHVLERELAQFDDAASDEEIKAKLQGLGYIS